MTRLRKKDWNDTNYKHSAVVCKEKQGFDRFQTF
jgi:hypothetical protein